MSSTAWLSGLGARFRVGTIEIRPRGESLPPLHAGLSLADLAGLMAEAGHVAAEEGAELAALERLQAGSSVGGARPKVVVTDGSRSYLAKLNHGEDAFNHARCEHWALQLAGEAGLNVPANRLAATEVGDALLVECFDCADAGGRYHLVSANALLKDAHTQRDPMHASYDDLVGLVRRYSAHVTRDLRQLYGVMLVNEAINNVDDHLRNFAFRQTEAGLALSPAYDWVPSPQVGARPHLGLGHDARRPRPGTDAATNAARGFQLRPKEARAINERVMGALQRTDEIMAAAGVGGRGRRMLERVVA